MSGRCALLVFALFLTGCGSKVNEANYYRIGMGTTEDKAEEWLGPGRPADVPTSMAGHDVKAKRWQAGDLKVTLLFENGKVIARKAEGLQGGKQESFAWPDAATSQPTTIQAGGVPKEGD